MKYMFWIVLVILITSTLIAHAQEQKGIDEHLENLSGQYAECTAYYELVYYAMDSANEMQTANAYKGLAGALPVSSKKCREIRARGAFHPHKLI
jgi:hypothetical protein